MWKLLEANLRLVDEFTKGAGLQIVLAAVHERRVGRPSKREGSVSASAMSTGFRLLRRSIRLERRSHREFLQLALLRCPTACFFLGTLSGDE